MKVIMFQGGLGNQIFIETFSRWLEKKYPKEKIYGYYPHMALNRHNGLEIEKWFDVSLPKESFLSNIIGGSLFWFNKLLRRLHMRPLFTSDDSCFISDTLFYEGYWQNQEYVNEMGIPSFCSMISLDDKNLEVLRGLEAPNAIAVHVRRGDYTNPAVDYIYGGICTLDYYRKAIEQMKSLVDNPKIFFFSDDEEYVRCNFKETNMIIVNFNKGKNSFYDMYLMSHASNLILANSTFSWWAASLNKKVKNVMCPNRWVNIDPKPNLIRKNWLVID